MITTVYWLEINCFQLIRLSTLSTLHSPVRQQYLVLHPLVVVGLVPPADEVSHQDDDDHGGQDAAHNDGDEVIGAFAIGLAVSRCLECIVRGVFGPEGVQLNFREFH